MRKNNKDYKPLEKYIADQDRKISIAEAIANKELTITAGQNVDVGMIIKHLRWSLFSTALAAKRLGLSPRAFLRLRRRYGVEPVYKQWMNAAHTERQYLYSD